MCVNSTSLFRHSVPLCLSVSVLLYRLKSFSVLRFCFFVCCGEHHSVHTAQNCPARLHACHVGHQLYCQLNPNSKSFIPDNAVSKDHLALRAKKNEFAKLAVRVAGV